MKKIICSLSAWLTLFVVVNAQTLQSPGGEFTMVFLLESDDTPTYTLGNKSHQVIKMSQSKSTIQS